MAKRFELVIDIELDQNGVKQVARALKLAAERVEAIGNEATGGLIKFEEMGTVGKWMWVGQ